MRIAIIGTGAVGGYFGAKLAAAGHELVFIARGRHLEALRRDGLRIVSPSGNLFVRDAVFTASPEDVDAIDLVLFCVKSYDTDAAAQAFGSLVGERTTIRRRCLHRRANRIARCDRIFQRRQNRFRSIGR